MTNTLSVLSSFLRKFMRPLIIVIAFLPISEWNLYVYPLGLLGIERLMYFFEWLENENFVLYRDNEDVWNGVLLYLLMCLVIYFLPTGILSLCLYGLLMLLSVLIIYTNDEPTS